MTRPVYSTPTEALTATDEFYANQKGFQYSVEMVTNWIKTHVLLPKAGRVLDLCCGDGIWSKGMQNVNPNLEFYGIDISQGAISKARSLLKTDAEHFVVGDAETDLPFPDDFFELIFARGPGLYNQHNMARPATIEVIEQWHRKLATKGVFYSIFYSNPERMGTYTPIDEVRLPYNRSPRQTQAVDFQGGKYHHTIQSFLSPFWKAISVEIVRYSFINNLHVLVTRKQTE